ncbi:hypothetical protein HNY73_015913 [Argiope bruennichi]|uniref:DUF19 domain-containing protein n=1 Tax=Argiope bruennichi TaxID=94029 RepID=A0A8T0EI39_ARGBR|nr:hypothetical protein HNY73_015913 [Argiope bruennichi]
MFLYIIVLYVLLKGVSGSNEVKFETSESLVPPKCMLEPEILLNLPFNSRALEDYCEHFLNYYKCVDKYREEFAEDKVEYLTLSLIKAEPFMRKKLCKQTSINQRYIMHAPCLEAVSHQFYDYFDFADSLIKKYNAQEPLPNKFMAVSYYCLSASVSLTCLGISVSKSCGPDAKKLYIQSTTLKMIPLIWFILLLFGGPLVESPCKMNPVPFCSNGYEQFFNNLPDDDESLNEACRFFTEYYRCMKSFSKECEISGSRKTFKYLQNLHSLIEDMCYKDHYMKQTYLNYAICYKMAMPGVRYCQEKFDTEYDSFFLGEDIKLDDANVTETVCNKHLGNVLCIAEEIRKKCGSDAKSIFQVVVRRSKYLQITCPLNE